MFVENILFTCFKGFIFLLYFRLKYISYLGRYLNGKPVGQAWLGLIGHGFLFGDVDPKNPGKITSEKAGYIYPGFELAIVGNYQENFLQSGRIHLVIL
jgi:hypothetical protein